MSERDPAQPSKVRKGVGVGDLRTDTANAQELFWSFDAMEGVPQPVPRGWPGDRLPGSRLLKAIYPGCLVALVIALASTWLSREYSAPVMLYALLFGMAFHFLHEEGRCVPGIEFASKTVLRLGVALLGVKITASQVLGLGVMPILTVIAAVTTTIGLGYAAARLTGQKGAFGILSGGAVGICGASAALAIASVLPRNEDSERDTILTVVAVTALSTLAMILYPMFAVAIGLSDVRAGIFLGGTIHDVAQVVGAGYTISSETGDIATYVKLVRVTMLIPVVFAISYLASRNTGSSGGFSRAPLPAFLLAFAALMAINSFGLLPKPVVGFAGDLSRWCLVTAIAALGMKTSFKALLTVGWRPVALLVVETGWIAGLVLTSIYIFH